jgi:Tat protein secretion system quality control protein TatD with DNase activity
MPVAIKNVVNKVAELRQTTPERIERLVHENFTHLLIDDPWISKAHVDAFR